MVKYTNKYIFVVLKVLDLERLSLLRGKFVKVVLPEDHYNSPIIKPLSCRLSKKKTTEKYI